MAFIPVANTVQAEMRYLIDGQNCENVLNFLMPATPTLSNMGTLAAGLATWWAAELDPYVSDDCQLREIYLTDLTSQTGPTLSYTTGLPNAGAVTGGLAPNNVSFCVSTRTANRGRSYRGRFYVAGIPRASFTNNEIASLSVVAYVDAVAKLAVSASFGGAVFVVVSKYANNAPRANGLATPVVSAVAIDNYVDSQRRRLPKRGT